MTDEDFVEQVLDHIAEKNKDVKPEDVDKVDDTISYVCHLIAILGEVHDTMDIGAYMSATTKDAFYEMGAKAYGDAFDKAYTSIVEDSKTVKGFWILKSVKLKKLYNKHITTLYDTLQEIEKTDPVMDNYLIPYMKKHYGSLMNESAESSDSKD